MAAGKTLIVADYGQLELRLLAHMANCKSMLEAFELGGDFHSRTALGMYDHIKEAIASGDCLLEHDGHGPPPVPLLKDKFGSERRKAKVRLQGVTTVQGTICFCCIIFCCVLFMLNLQQHSCSSVVLNCLGYFQCCMWDKQQVRIVGCRLLSGYVYAVRNQMPPFIDLTTVVCLWCADLELLYCLW